MALVISTWGTVANLRDDQVNDATWDQGCVRIRRTRQSVIVSVDSDRLTGPAIAATLYELADMEPQKICLAIGKNRIIEVLIGVEAAFRRICNVFESSCVYD
jgi:hypothetical protein